MATLEERIVLLATRLRTKINDIIPRLLPTGGSAGQILSKKSGTNFDLQWQDIRPGRLRNAFYFQTDFLEFDFSGAGVTTRTTVPLFSGYTIIYDGSATNYNNAATATGYLSMNFGASTSTSQFIGIYNNVTNLGNNVNFPVFNGPTQQYLLDWETNIFFVGKGVGVTRQEVCRVGLLFAQGTLPGETRGIWFEAHPNVSLWTLNVTKGSGTEVTQLPFSGFAATVTSNVIRRMGFVDPGDGTIECYFNRALIAKIPHADQPASGRYSPCVEVVRLTGTNNYGSAIRVDYMDIIWTSRNLR